MASFRAVCVVGPPPLASGKLAHFNFITTEFRALKLFMLLLQMCGMLIWILYQIFLKAKGTTYTTAASKPKQISRVKSFVPCSDHSDGSQ